MCHPEIKQVKLRGLSAVTSRRRWKRQVIRCCYFMLKFGWQQRIGIRALCPRPATTLIHDKWSELSTAQHNASISSFNKQKIFFRRLLLRLVSFENLDSSTFYVTMMGENQTPARHLFTKCRAIFFLWLASQVKSSTNTPVIQGEKQMHIEGRCDCELPRQSCRLGRACVDFSTQVLLWFCLVLPRK
jgi:hypothetical protein